MKNFDSAVERINKVKDFDSLSELEKSFERLYKYGFLNDKELVELDHKLLHKSNVLNGYRNLGIKPI
jgi:hypothetical protein